MLLKNRVAIITGANSGIGHECALAFIAEGAMVAGVDINTGNMAGDEIVQMYIRDRFSSVTRPVKELKDFARIHLEPGETRTVEFSVTPDKLMFLDKDLRPVVEPGEFIVMVGPSSDDRDLHTASFFVR